MSDQKEPGLIDQLKRTNQKLRDVKAGAKSTVGFIDLWLNLFAQTSILLVRRRIGVRTIKVIPVLIGFFVISVSGRGQFEVVMGFLGMVFLGLAVIRTVRARRDRTRYSNSMGESWLMLLTKGRCRKLVDCVVEPVLIALVGWTIMWVAPMLSVYLWLSAFGLMLMQLNIWTNKYNAELDQQDQMIEAESHTRSLPAQTSQRTAEQIPVSVANAPTVYLPEPKPEAPVAADPHAGLDADTRAILDPVEANGEFHTQNRAGSRH